MSGTPTSGGNFTRRRRSSLDHVQQNHVCHVQHNHVCQKEMEQLFYRQTDSHGETSIPHTFVARGVINMTFLWVF